MIKEMPRLRWSLILLAGSLFGQTGDPTLAAIRDYARNYVENLPNYTATQFIKRKLKSAPAPQLPPQTQTDQIEEQIGYVNHQESHKILRFNGRVMGDQSPVRTEGIFSTGEFGGLLETLSSEDIGATFQPAKQEKVNGKRVDVFEFHIPALPAGYGIKEAGRTTLVAFTGRIYADAESHAVLRIQFHCIDFPVALRYKSLEMELDFAPAKVGGEEFVLPARYVLKSSSDSAENSVEATYRNYQKFGADSTIIFDGAGEP